MKKLKSIFILGLILSVAFFLQRVQNRAVNSPAVKELSVPDALTPLGVKKQNDGAGMAAVESEYQLRKRVFEEKKRVGRDKEREIMARLAKLTLDFDAAHSPEERAEKVMKFYRPKYEGLFDSWKLGAEERNKILSVIKNHERYLIARVGVMMKDMNTETHLTNFEFRGKFHQFHQSDLLMEQSIMETQLIELIGPDRYNELAKVKPGMLKPYSAK